MNKTSSAVVRALLLGTSCLTVLSLGVAKADPTGGTVVTGSATIASHGNSTTINQSTNRALINWDSFSIAAGGSVRFNQPGTGSITLNRVVGSAPSSIYGSILANGQVWLINSNGILFGRGAQANVGGLIATTSNISDGDFANGNFNFSGGSGASVVNQGTIRARNGGSVVLSGASVQNQGLIQADAGTVVLGGASAFTVDFDGDNLLRYAIAAPAGAADNGQTGVSNSGTVQANNGGRVIMTARAAADIAGAVINSTGIVSATSAKLQNGEVVIDGGDGVDVNVSGTVDASGVRAGQTGGFVSVTGRNVDVADGTTISASGDVGGGTILIGGGAHGAGPITNAQNTHVGKATLTADASRRGNGGTLVVWSNGLTDFSGIASAMAGAMGGNGGFVETSGHDLKVGGDAKVNTLAPMGHTGTWLLDPDTIIIDDAGTDGIGSSNSLADISPATIENALVSTNVTLQATSAIQINDAVTYSSGNALSLLSQGSIVIGADIQNAGSGAINLIGGWNGTQTDPVHFTDPGVYGAGEGNGYIEFSNDASVGSFGGTTTFAADSVIMGIYGTHTQIGYRGAGGGDINVLTTGDLSLSMYNGGSVQIGNGATFGTIAGDVTGNVDITVGGTLGLTEYSGAIVLGNRATAGHAETGNFTLTAGDRIESGNALNESILGDIVGGDVSITVNSALLGIGPLDYTSAHTLSLSTLGTLDIDHEITNSGTGTLVLSGYLGITQEAPITVAVLAASSDAGSIELSRDSSDDIVANAVGAATFGADGNVLFHDTIDLTIGGPSIGGISANGYVVIEAERALTIDGTVRANDGDDCGEGTCIYLSAATGITETANGSLAGGTLYANSAGAITLENAANAITGAVYLYGDDSVSFVNSVGLTLGGGETNGTFNAQALTGGLTVDGEVDAGGAMTLTAHDDINETAENGDLEGGALTATSTDGNVYLYAGYNDFDGAVSLNAAGDVQFFNDDATNLGASTIGGQLYVTSSGDVTQSGAIAAGSLAVQAGDPFCDDACANGDVTLTNPDNTIAGDVAFNALGDVNFTDAVGFNLGRVIFHDVAYDEDIEDHTYIGGDLTATALTGGITINGGVETGLNVGCDCDPTLTAAGDITETEDGYITGFDLNATSTGGRISLLADNELLGTVSLNAAGDALFFNDVDTNLGASTVGGTLFVSAIGNVTQSGALSATNLVVEAIASECGCSEGDVLLDNAANAISGKVAFEADGDVTFKNSIGFTLADVDIDDLEETFTNSIGGSLAATALSGGITIDGGVDSENGADPTLTAAGDIVETANGTITGGDLTVTSTGGSIALNNAGNLLSGVVSLNAAGNASFANGDNMQLGASNVAGNLTVLAEGNIDVVGSIQNAASGNITLVAGWDGGDALQVGADGTYGLDGGTVNIGGSDAAGNVYVGSAHGTTHVYANSLSLNTDTGNAQLGYHGAGGGDIFVNVTQNINGFGNGSNSNSLQLGNGTLGNDVVGNVTGNINLDAGNQTAFFSQAGASWLGNHASAGYIESGNVTSVSATGSYSADFMQGDLGTSANSGGNLFIGFRNNFGSTGFHIGGLEYNSPHAFVFANSGGLDVTGRVINHGTGDVTLVAGWDSHTIGSAAQIVAAHAYGLNGALTNIGGNHHYGTGDGFDINQFQDVSLGSAGGLTSILTGDLTIAPAAGYYAQIGFHGSTGGAIDVEALGNLTMTGGTAAHDYAMIGNGSLNGDVTGNVTGNINLKVGGLSTLSTAAGLAWIGNAAAAGYSQTGDVVFFTTDLNGGSALGTNVAADLTGGDFTLGILDSAATTKIDGGGTYNSTHTLNLLTAGSFEFDSSVQNAGSGAINIVAGWDGTTLDAARFGDAGVYGNHNGSLLFGGANAVGNVSVGSAGGATSVYAANVTLNAAHGTAQLGYHGNGTGAVNVTALNSVSLFTAASNLLALIGNGGTDIGGSIGGAVNVSTGGGVFLTAANQGGIAGIGNVGGFGASEGGTVTVNTHGGALTMIASASSAHTHIGNWTKNDTTGTSSGNIKIDAGAISLIASNSGYNQIGNGAFRSSNDTGALSGDILIHATTFLASATANGQSRVGNLGLGTSSGNISLITTGNVTLTGNGGLVNIGNVSAPVDINGNSLQGQETGNILIQSGGAVTLTASNAGNARIENGGALSGTLTVTAAGDVTLAAGAPGGSGSNSVAFIGALVVGNGGMNVAVTSTGGKVQVDANEAASLAQIGNYENITIGGTMSGTVSVSAANLANGNIGLTASGLNASAQIGNAGFGGETVSGDVSLIAGNAVTIGSGNAIIGDTNQNPSGDSFILAPFSGNLFVSANSLSGNVAPSLTNDLRGGNVLLEIFGPSFSLNGPVTYNSGYTFTVLAAGNIALSSNLQNAGSGAITLVAGWNGTTADAAHFFDTGVFGNNNGAILIGGAGATGDVAVGSAGGPTRLGAKDITLAAVNGYAQLGYHGAAGGALTLNATGIVSLTGGANAALYAQIGNGTTFGSNAAGGDVSIASASIAGSANGAVTGAMLKLAAASGNIGASAAALRIAAGSLQLTTNGGSVFLTSPNGGVSFGGTGVNLSGGNLTLAAAGPITQTAAIRAASLDVSTLTGAIALTNGGNSFSTLTVTTHGTDNASFNDSTGLAIAAAQVGGTLTVSAAGSISQTGAIVAAGLDVTAGATPPGGSGQQGLAVGGTIDLSNSGNAFGTLTVHTANGNDATIVDSSAVVVAGAVVSGKFTLTAGGAITQSGAIVAGQSVISTTSGDITLTNSANAFGPLTVVTPGNASFTQASLLTVTSANVGGVLTLNAGSIAQTGAIVAASLNAMSTVGGIVLGNAGNSFGTLSVHTTGANDGTIADSTAVVVASSAVGGKFTLSAGGTVSQSGAIAATQLAVTTTAGNIVLTNLANAVAGTVQFATPGSATFYDTTGMNVAATTVGGDLILLSKGNVNFRGSVQSTTGNITVVAGWDGVTVAPASFGNAGVYGNNTGPNTGNIVIGGTGATGAVAVGSKSGSTSLYANYLAVIGANGTAQLGYHGAGGGAILVRTLQDLTVGANAFSAMIGNGSLTSDVTGNQTGDIDLRLAGNLIFSGTAQTWLGNVAHSGTETGNLIAVVNDTDDSNDHRFSDYIAAALGGGDVTLGFTGSDDQGPGNAVAFSSVHTLNILTVGNFVLAGSIQNAGTGAINLVAGWDGHTLNAASYGNAGVYGNNGKGVLIGGANATGNAAFGSAGGTTSIYAASLALSAVHGYAQLGFNGHGAGAIVVNTTGGVSLTGGTSAGQFAQIGNGGQGTSGNNSGAITINALGDLVLTGGAGAEAYAQIGHGGAESNTGANGYSNVAPITVTAANVLLSAGAGNAAYVQIGNGGYKSGLNLAGGTAVNGGAITITSGHAVSLTGNGADAYAQIGNGGSQSNANTAASAGGSDSGDIVVHAPNGAAGSVTLAAGAGANAYSQIGNGGYAVNAGPTTTVANWTITGNVSVTDLALSGGNGGPNAYAQIGNGDASHNGTANVSGDVTIDANGQITYTQGTALHSQATIGNFTGLGTVSGTVTGAVPAPPSEVANNPVLIGVVVGNNPDNGKPGTNNNPITTIPTIVIPDAGPGGNSAVTLEHATPGPLASLDENGDGDGPHSSDGATVVIADSLDGARKAGAATILQGLLKAGLANGNAVHAVPPADQDFSSWGNEALWQ